jgi:hypothetical protein
MGSAHFLAGCMMAIELIVDGYVRLGDRRALAELKAHREDLLAQLEARKGGWFDLRPDNRSDRGGYRSDRSRAGAIGWRACIHAPESEVSRFICKMPFVWIEADDDPGPGSLRGYIERNAIALLSNYGKEPVDPPSPGWLGHYCDRERSGSRGCGTPTMSMKDTIWGSSTALKRMCSRWSGSRDRRHSVRSAKKAGRGVSRNA